MVVPKHQDVLLIRIRSSNLDVVKLEKVFWQSTMNSGTVRTRYLSPPDSQKAVYSSANETLISVARVLRVNFFRVRQQLSKKRKFRSDQCAR